MSTKNLSAAAQSQCDASARPFVLAATILASALAFIDGSVTHITLPAVQDEFDASFFGLQWVTNAYALMLSGLILVGGGLGDRYGRRRVFVSGIAVFGVASLLAAAAPSLEFLVASRALQGAGAALLVPQSLAIIAASFPREARGAAIGLWAGASAVTTALGPPLGGLLIDAFSWRAAFWINPPLCAAAIWLALRYAPESRAEAAPGPLDWPGGLLAVLGFGAFSWGVMRLSEGADTATLALIGAGVLGVVLFTLAEKRAAAPLAPLWLFRDPVFLGGNIVTVGLYGAMAATMFLLPFDLIARRGFSAAEAGAAMLPLGLTIGALSRPMGAMAARLGARMFLTAGPVLVAVAALWLSLTIEDWRLGVIGPILCLSLGMALVVAPLTTMVINAAPDAQSGAASGLNNAASRLAGLLAVAICGAVASAVFLASQSGGGIAALRFGELPPLGAPERAAAEAAFLNGYAAGLRVAAGGAILAAVAAALTATGRPSISPAPSTH